MSEAGRFPISGMEHNSANSLLQIFARTYTPNDLVLYSNGDLEVKSDVSDIIGNKPLVLTNIRDTDFIKFTRPRYKNKPLHNSITLLSFVLSCIFLLSSGFTIDYLFYEADLTFFELFSIFVAPFMIILLDHLRLRYVQVSQLLIHPLATCGVL